MGTPEMRFSQAMAAWSWDLDQDPDVEIVMAGDAAAPCPRRLQILHRLISVLDPTRRKAEDLIESFTKIEGELELTGIEMAQQAEKLDCDFVLHFIFLPVSDPRKYDTYFDVCFYDRPDHLHEPSKLHPFKFVVGFY